MSLREWIFHALILSSIAAVMTLLVVGLL